MTRQNDEVEILWLIPIQYASETHGPTGSVMGRQLFPLFRATVAARRVINASAAA
jgi:hypothetical protein